MEDLFEVSWNTSNNNNAEDPFASIDASTDPFDTLQSNAKHSVLDDIFGTDSMAPPVPSSAAKSGADGSNHTQPANASNVDENNAIWDLMENPNPDNDVTAFFHNISASKSSTKATNTASVSNFRGNGMLTREITQISKITPAAKYLIDAYFTRQCLVHSDVIVPECVEILAIMYLGQPAFIHCYLGDSNAEPLQSSHRLMVVYGYHCLNDIVEEYMHSVNALPDAQQRRQENGGHSNSVLDELFNESIQEKEKRIWCRDIKMPIPPYNGADKETFNHIDELFFIDDEAAIDSAQPRYNNWDEFLGVDESEQTKKAREDDWKIATASDVDLFGKSGLPEIEILIEQKGLLSEWVREYKAPQDPWQKLMNRHLLEAWEIQQHQKTMRSLSRKHDHKLHAKLLNLKYWK